MNDRDENSPQEFSPDYDFENWPWDADPDWR